MKEDRVYLQHIRDAIQKIMDYTQEGKEIFLEDNKGQDAVIRNLEIIGEAVKNLSQKLRDQHSDIPWKQIAGMRDEMIHEYFGVDLDIVWNVVKRDLPVLKEKINSLLPIKP